MAWWFLIPVTKVAVVTALKVGAIVLASAAVVAVITYERIRQWFAARESPQWNEDAIQFTIKEDLANGNIGVGYGVMTPSGEVLESESLEAQTIDQELVNRHARHRLVVGGIS